MLLLALDTATSVVTVAVHDGTRVVGQVDAPGARSHGELLAPGIREALRQADAPASALTDVVVGTGPGPFTGLRVGIVTGRVLAHALGARIHGLVSLDALAAQAASGLPDGPLLVATDARRREVYWARYAVTGGRASRLDPPSVCRPAELPFPARELPTAGRGPVLYPEAFGPSTGDLDVDAGVLAGLAHARLTAGETLDDTEPCYLRRPDVHGGGSLGAQGVGPQGVAASAGGGASAGGR